MVPDDLLDKLLTQLEQARRDFSRPAAERIRRLIARLGRAKFRDPGLLIRFHEALLYFRAYPRNGELLDQAEELLASFGRRIAELRSAGVDLDPLEEPDVSGIAGSSFSAIFSYDVARRLVELEPGRLHIDFDRFEPDDRLAPLWRQLFPLVEEDLLVEAHVPYLEWLSKAAGGRGHALEWLFSRLDQLPISPRRKADLYAALQLPLRWDLTESRAARTAISRAPRRVFYHSEHLIPRVDVLLERELKSPPLEVKPLDLEGGRAFLNMAVATSAARYRELHGFTYGDPGTVLHARAGRGVEIFFCGVPPEWRLPLRAYHAAMILKNGVPTGYFETLSLFDRMEIGFNLYYSFREGETAWIFARMLRLFHQLLGTTSFSIDPYQIGLNNEEAIASGAFWFYRRLGFRPVLPEVVRVLAPEECRMLKDPCHRTPARTLRKLAMGPLLFEMPDAPQGDWDRFSIRTLALATRQAVPAETAARVAEALDVRVGPHAEFANLALILDQVPDLADWPAPDKKAVLEIVRARMSPDESRYLSALQRHSRLRTAVIRLGSGS